ncbi:MFS general substrate transporter [Aureobasidium pullulans EXF-150]|uniref:MFS general substrate transporter n=1 Tax=Aureobasidium pullulans EXF-150 TaxID=1043002 RepID=A0A074XT06_AURPU|nr:MFS general substrate transporter [Aureobasidium pullulans EXF-150]KEQ86794.1 MFS general substrate transporter [Aureobasidium pullulans EXF-150]
MSTVDSHSPPLAGRTESAPLLGEDFATVNAFNKRRLSWHILLLICVSVVASDFGNYLSYAPSIEIYESIICEQLYGGRLAQGFSVVERLLCKAPDVQNELATINSWKDTFDQLPGILLAVPYGLMADRVGRKPVLLLSLTGLIFEETFIRLVCWENKIIPLRAIWAAPVFQLIGGGPQIATSMAYVMITDIFPADKRASVFFIMGAAILLGEIFATPLSAFLMSWSPWIPSLSGLAIQILGFFAATIVPETLPEQSGLVHRTPPTTDRDDDAPNENTRQQHGTRNWSSMRETVTRVLPDANMTFILISFLFASIGRQAVQFILQYASLRFQWTFARASALITIKGLVTFVALLMVLPKISTLLSNRTSAERSDFLIVQGSVWLLFVGSILMALAARPALFIIGVILLGSGWGFYSALRSLAASLVLPNRIGVVNTSIGLSQSVGTMIAGPLFATAFRYSTGLIGVWQGLCYLVAATLFLSAACTIYFVQLPRLYTRS